MTAYLVDFEIPNFVLGVLQSNADLSTKQFYMVDLLQATGAGLTGPAVDLPAASGNPVIGVLQTKSILGEAAEVMCSGVSKVIAGGTIALGAKLMTDATGKAVTATSGNYIVGRALDNAASGDIFSMLIERDGKL